MFFKNLAAGIAALGAVFVATPSMAVPVDLELQLLVDVSGSVDNTEYNLQLDGYEAAFRNAGIISAIENGSIGSIAVQLILWSSAGSQAVVVNWTQISDATSANAFADAIAAVVRTSSGLTAPGSALNFGVPLFNNGFEGTRLVIDVSGDGSENDGANTATARDAALAAGIDAINGLPILGSEANLDAWYLANIVGGPTGFLIAANGFADFENAILTKIGREITGEVPIPGAIPLMVTGIALLWRRSRRKKAAA